MKPTAHSPQPTFVLIFITLFLVFTSFGFDCFAQTNQKTYLLEGFDKSDLTPNTMVKVGDFYEITFNDSQLTNIFQDFSILNYENTFEGLDLCDDSDLDKVFSLTITISVNPSRFLISPLIKRVEVMDEAEALASGELPNDYRLPTYKIDPDGPMESVQNDSIRNYYLDLIQAPCAWELTKGDGNVLVGVSDSYFSEVHEELDGKFEAILGYVHDEEKPDFDHGIGVASLIASHTDNNKGTASIGYNTKLVGNAAIGWRAVKDLVLWSIDNNDKIRVINMSWGRQREYFEVPNYLASHTIEQRLYKCLFEDYNILLVASGNNQSFSKYPETNFEGWKAPNETFSFPASYSSIVSVTSVGSRDNPDTYDYTSDHGRADLKDVLWNWGQINNEGWHVSTNILNDSIDIAAPAYYIFRAANNRISHSGIDAVDSYRNDGGETSQAAPIVSGVAALMFAVNPNLTAAQAKNILRVTSDRIDTIPHNQEFFGANPDQLSKVFGRVNAFKAVKMALNFDEYEYDYEAIPSSVDLMIRDNIEDIGQEPNETTEIFWNSPDIWVRNQPDGIEQHQNPEYDPFEESYVYVRIKNIGCDPSSTDDQLKLYWTKANASMSWPVDYMGGKYFSNGALQGDTIASVNLPVIKPGEEKIIQVPWSNIPDPEDYTDINEEPWHFCLLARIISDDDPIHIENHSIAHNDKYNNNIASRNLTVLDFNPSNIDYPISGGFIINNPNNQTGTYDLQLIPDAGETGSMIYEEAEVSVILDKTLIDAWVEGGEVSSNLRRTGTNTFLVMDTDARLKNLIIPASDFGIATLQFNFLTKEITEKQTFLYHAIQREVIHDAILGGESFEINK